MVFMLGMLVVCMEYEVVCWGWLRSGMCVLLVRNEGLLAGVAFCLMNKES